MDPSRRQVLRNAVVAGAGALATGTPGKCLDSQLGSAIRVRVIDEETGRGVPARIRLVDANGAEVVPLGRPATLAAGGREGDVRFQSRRFSYVDGAFEIDARHLPVSYQVLKGYEFTIAEGKLSAEALRDKEFVIPLSRWSNLAEQGWYSGDIHVHHIAPKTCHFEMDAEDVNVANILTSDFTDDQDQFEGKLNAHSSSRRLVYVSQEFRNNQLGHLCLLNLKKLVQPVKPLRHTHYPLLIEACEETHQQGGYVAWAHFPSLPGVESPLGVALEKVDGLEILSVQDPRTFAHSPWWKEIVPEMASNHGVLLWYRYLNCGYRLTATAGTDKMTTFVTVGSNRVYARTEGDLTYQRWIEALRAGRTFITNSPILSLTVNGREPGTTVHLNSRKDKVLQIQASADSQMPYDFLEIVINGTVVAQASPSGTRNHAEISLEHHAGTSCWVAARVLEDLAPYHQRGLNFWKVHIDRGTRLSDHYGTRMPETVFAHSSPVYVIRDGRPIRSFDDAEYYVRYLDNVLQWLRKGANFARPQDREASLEAFRKGRAIFLQRAREAGGR